MKTFRQFIPLSVILAAGLLSAPLPAAEQALFSDNFDTDTSANWNLVEGSRDGTPDYTADFAFDYGAVEMRVEWHYQSHPGGA